MAKQELTLKAYWPNTGALTTWKIKASVLDGLAVHEQIGTLDGYTLSLVACGLAITHGSKALMQRVRKAMLATDIPWAEILSAASAEPYREEIQQVLRSFRRPK